MNCYYNEPNRLVEGTSWKGDKSAYTYNGLGVRTNNTHTTHSGSVDRRNFKYYSFWNCCEDNN